MHEILQKLEADYANIGLDVSVGQIIGTDHYFVDFEPLAEEPDDGPKFSVVGFDGLAAVINDIRQQTYFGDDNAE